MVTRAKAANALRAARTSCFLKENALRSTHSDSKTTVVGTKTNDAPAWRARALTDRYRPQPRFEQLCWCQSRARLCAIVAIAASISSMVTGGPEYLSMPKTSSIVVGCCKGVRRSNTPSAVSSINNSAPGAHLQRSRTDFGSLIFPSRERVAVNFCAFAIIEEPAIVHLIPVRFDVDTSKPLKRRAGHPRGPWLRANHGAGAQCANQVSIRQAHRDLV